MLIMRSQQLQIWQHEKAGVTKVGNAGEGWDAMIVMVKNHKVDLVREGLVAEKFRIRWTT